MLQPRTAARLAGLLFLLTHFTSVGAVILYGGSTFAPGAPLAGRPAVLAGGVLDVILAAAVVGSAAALFALLRGYNPGAASGYLALRTLEASVILAGVVVLLPTVAAPTTTSSPVLDASVVAALRLLHDWTFLIGPGLISPINTVVLAWILHRHRLVPRTITTLGFGGAVLIAAANLAVLFGLTPSQPVAAVPIFAWEISLAIYLITRGLRSVDDVRPGLGAPSMTVSTAV